MQRTWPVKVIASVLLLACVGFAYANHFQNSFHFDDSHTVVDNPYIRDLHNAPLFFQDARTFSNLPANRSYRPIVSLSLALDYWLAKGLHPEWFHITTFFWYLLQLVLMQMLFHRLCDKVRPHAGNWWLACFAAALYGVHPANAETVNYVIQRGDIYSTLGVFAGLAMYVLAPRFRKYGMYLVPVAAALLSKPPALVFPAILFLYIWLFEDNTPRKALRKCLPATLVVVAAAVFTSAMTPKEYTPGATSGYAYRITQPLVALRYFNSFFLPTRLSADTDHSPVSSVFEGYAWAGFLFLAALLYATWFCCRKRELRPSAFGLGWFMLALIPTAVFPLAEVENDHRMFFPFVGLVLAVCWPLALWIYKAGPLSRPAKLALVAGCLTILSIETAGTRERNRVWHTDESLWLDVTVKSPNNGRGLMNYGLTQMAKGETRRALDYFERALVLTPNYATLEVNLGIANSVLQNEEAARQHFARAIFLSPSDATSYFFYARWLQQQSRFAEAREQLRNAVAINPDHLASRDLLMQCSAALNDWDQLNQTATETLQKFPGEPSATRYLAIAIAGKSRPPAALTADDYLNLSMRYHREGKFQQAIQAARETLRLNPKYAEAYNNIAAAYEGMQAWDLAIEAARQALKLKPDFQLAKNNLSWSQEQRKKTNARL